MNRVILWPNCWGIADEGKSKTPPRLQQGTGVEIVSLAISLAAFTAATHGFALASP
jgi:hypothetical protein